MVARAPEGPLKSPQITKNGPPIAVGFQYLFGILPFGRVKLKDPDQELASALLRYGLRLTPGTTKIDLDAYDLVLTRSLSCKITTTVEPIRGGTSTIVAASHHEWSRFGFGADLARAWTRCLWNFEEALRQGVLGTEN